MALAWVGKPVRISLGNQWGMIGRMSGAADPEDLVTGFKRVDYFKAVPSVAGVQDANYAITRNTTTAVDAANDAPGTVHIVGMNSGSHMVEIVGV